MNPASIALAVSFILFFTLQYLSYKCGITALSDKKGSFQSLSAFNIKHTIGILILGLTVVLFYEKDKHFYQLPAAFSLPGISLAVLLIIIAGIAFAASNNSIHHIARHNTIGGFPLMSVILFMIIRCCFLIVYECYFRGLLLAATTAFSSTGMAVMINLLLYAGVHAFGKSNEILACIPFGLTVCCLTLYWHSVLPAILLHITFAAVYEGNVLRCLLVSPKTLTT
jgi:Type II CAAX prenyl endopeptidase Rce1-like